jgi:hypothetical protein
MKRKPTSGAAAAAGGSSASKPAAKRQKPDSRTDDQAKIQSQQVTRVAEHSAYCAKACSSRADHTITRCQVNALNTASSLRASKWQFYCGADNLVCTHMCPALVR